jgi:hypothetical protein
MGVSGKGEDIMQRLSEEALRNRRRLDWYVVLTPWLVVLTPWLSVEGWWWRFGYLGPRPILASMCWRPSGLLGFFRMECRLKKCKIASMCLLGWDLRTQRTRKPN